VVRCKNDSLTHICFTPALNPAFFLSFDYSSDALSEIESFCKRSHQVIIAPAVQEILDGRRAMDLVFIDQEANL
jgi:hypothetical protein